MGNIEPDCDLCPSPVADYYGTVKGSTAEAYMCGPCAASNGENVKSLQREVTGMDMMFGVYGSDNDVPLGDPPPEISPDKAWPWQKPATVPAVVPDPVEPAVPVLAETIIPHLPLPTVALSDYYKTTYTV